MKSATRPLPLRATRVLAQVCERVWYGYYSLSTERSYVHRIRLTEASAAISAYGRLQILFPE